MVIIAQVETTYSKGDQEARARIVNGSGEFKVSKGEKEDKKKYLMHLQCQRSISPRSWMRQTAVSESPRIRYWSHQDRVN